jgi:transcriptional regulator GlxA family with amidase domain
LVRWQSSTLGVSERQVSRIFREYGGVARWNTDERLERARDLLTSPGRRTVAQVAEQCGFGSQSYFARVFKQRFAVSPREMAELGPSGGRERAAG